MRWPCRCACTSFVVLLTADRILPIDGQGRHLHAALPDARYVEIDGGPHVMCVTHANEVNRELLAFVAQPAPVIAAA